MKYIPLTFLIFFACGQQSNQKDIADSKQTDFERFTMTFDKYNSIIPDNLLVQYLREDTVDMEHRTYLTIGKINFSQNLLGLLYKMQCQAGGQCGASYLVIYDNELFVDKIEIEHAYADAGFENKLDYKINGNTIELNLNVSDHFDDEDGNTILVEQIDSTFYYRVNLKNGRIIKD